MGTSRVEFKPATISQIGKAAMYVCANPGCLLFTGYSTNEGKPRAVAEAAHILPAGSKGPRATKDSKADRLSAASNGIWLCLTCHQLIDDDPNSYPETTLHEWKKRQAEVLRRIVGKDLEAALLALGKEKRHDAECQEFLSFLENRRVLYEGMDHEFPPRVLESLSLIRERIVQLRAKLSPDAPAFTAVQRIQKVIDTFLREIGSSTDLTNLKCDADDPLWLKFSSELLKLREGIVIIMKIIAGDANYKLTWV
ncbi:HNH endonuclease [Sorangium sp. So ce1128]